MSTPSVTILKNLVLNWKSNQMEEETIATFYRHYDGYPSCHAIDIANSLVVASRTKPEQHIDFSGASVERNILNNRNWCQHFLKAMCMADADIEFIGEDKEFYPDEHPQILEREVGYIFPLMEVEPTICIELKDEG